ncbi:MAG: glycosyltransferase family 2 protein [Ottowia sp.]|nr:glycosyltransferase family 2 protein [Ottowia sp.]
MISIICAIHNQLAVNQLYWEYLQRYTHYPFELIVIDNGSTDGSAEFFDSVGAIVIRNQANYAYPHSQNQGIAIAQYDWLAFLNNDIIVAPNWDLYFVESMQRHDLDVATSCGIECVENARATKKLKRRWKRIKNPIGYLFGFTQKTLRLMHRWMYGDWEQFCERRRTQFKHQIKEGFVGNTVMMQRRALTKIGLWDERIQGADFDIYLRTKTRSRDIGDIKPVHICLDIFIHHYIRLTSKSHYPPFVDQSQLISIEEKWSNTDREFLRQLNT